MTLQLKNQQLKPKTLPYTPLAVVMGKTGFGKTTLCNMLCGTQHAAGSDDDIVTRNLYQNPVNCGSYPFALVDTPGTDSKQDTYKYAYLLKSALTSAAINTIFCVVKYYNRFRNIINDFDELVVPVAAYATNIVVLVSHSDVSKDPLKDFKQICALFDEDYPKIANVIFYSVHDPPDELANLMYRCVCNMERITLNISDEEFYFNFKIYQKHYKIEKNFQQFIRRKNQKEEEFTKFINSLESECQSVEDKDELLRMLMVKFKEEMENLSDEFIKKHDASMTELDYYGFHIDMRKELIKSCNLFTDKVAAKMSYSLFDNTDPRNLIKQCPNCGEIWYKTEGCNGVTSCGNNGFSSYYDVRAKPFWRFTLQRINGVLRWTKAESNKRELPPKSRTSDDKRRGCGTSFEWGKLPPISEEKIKKLFQVKTIEEAKQLIRNTNYIQLREEYSRSIDVTRYT